MKPKPEWKCPACGSTDLAAVFNSTVTYTQLVGGGKEQQCCEDDSLQYLSCNRCEEESDGDDAEEWKND